MTKEDLTGTEFMVGLDIGTSSVKAVAFSLRGDCLGKTAVPYPIHSPQPGWQEQDPDKVFNATVQCLKKLLEKLPGKLIGVVFSSAMHSLIALDADGNHFTGCILWSDTRGDTIARQLKGTALGKNIYQYTGTPIHPMSPLIKIAWLKQHWPTVFEKTWKFIGIKEYVVYKLTGTLMIDYSTASATGLFNGKLCQWHPESLDFAGISPEKLPVPVPPEKQLGPINPSIASKIGLPLGTPFFMGASDGCLANLGAGATHPGEAVLTIGTSGALRMNALAKQAADPQERIFNYLLTEQQFMAGGASNNGGQAYAWFTNEFFGVSPGTIRLKSKQQALDKIPAGSNGLLFLPYLYGERAPIWDAGATGGFFGLTHRHTLDHFHKAVMEGILLNFSLIGEVLESVVAPIDRIYANGGFANFPAWVQMAADVFGKKILLSESVEASALGAAMLGMKSLGLITEFDLPHLKASQTIFYPNDSKHPIYQESLQRLQKIYGEVSKM